MELEIDPEPTDAERDAIVAALAAAERDPDPRGPWWRAGLREALEDQSSSSRRRRTSQGAKPWAR